MSLLLVYVALGVVAIRLINGSPVPLMFHQIRPCSSRSHAVNCDSFLKAIYVTDYLVGGGSYSSHI